MTAERENDNRGFTRGERERDLVLGPGQYANILDETKGHVTVYAGPSKTSLSATDRPVKFMPIKRSFEECVLEDSIKTFAYAPKGSYIILHNPTSGERTHPNTGPNPASELLNGSKINVEGPETFALYPGQYAKTVEGHRLRSNQYVIVRVYDEEAAKENWSKATIKLQKNESDEDTEVSEEEAVEAMKTPDLTEGRQIVIEGTKVSFYIPPTGIEIVEDKDESYVREAVTLELLEYCILLDEDGNKRYVRGPAVVFPKPTEKFVRKEKSRKFRAIELNDLMGIYVKVIADHETEEEIEGNTKFITGDELFITGKDQKIYYPRPEHAIIKYGDKIRHYALAIPEGEARYVLNRIKGEVNLVRGPVMFLPDPRTEVIVNRPLTEREVKLWFPGNVEALAYNQTLNMDRSGDLDYIMESRVDIRGDRLTKNKSRSMAFSAAPENTTYESVGMAATEELKRGTSFTPPRSITIDSKYDGAVTIDVWPGYAVQVVSKTGERKVIVGPEVYLLEYDETLEKMSFSTGTPKNDDKLKKDVYLCYQYNTISDVISVETKDLCPVDVTVSYRVSFEGDSSKWFSVENPVKFLTDHLRSVLRNKVKQIGIEDFYAGSIDIVRDTILGKHGENNRPGRMLDENGMKVYDLEVLEVEIMDDEISNLLETSQHDAVNLTLQLEKAKLELESTKQNERITREIYELKAQTENLNQGLMVGKAKAKMEAQLAQLNIDIELDVKKSEARDALTELSNETERKKLELKKEQDEQLIAVANEKLSMAIKEMNADAAAVAAKAEAISPQLMAVLESVADKKLVGELAQNFNVLKILGGKSEDSIVDMATKLFGGTGLGEALKNIQLHGHFDSPGKELLGKVKEM